MRKLIIVLLFICQSFVFGQGSIPEISPTSKMDNIVKYYDFVLNINGELAENKVEVFRQALSQYSIVEIASSGILEKAYNISLEEYERILNKDFYSKINFFQNSTLEELIQFTLKAPIASFDRLLNRSSDYYRALRDLDPVTLTRRHHVTKIIEAIMEHADEIFESYKDTRFSILLGKASPEEKAVIQKKHKNVSHIKDKAFQLFHRFDTIEQAKLLSRIVSSKIIERYPREVVSSLQKHHNETAEVNNLIFEYFKSKSKLNIEQNEFFLINYSIRKNTEKMANLFGTKEELFLDYLDSIMNALGEEHGFSPYYGYDSYLYSELYDSSLTIAELLKNNERLIPIYLNSLNLEYYYDDFPAPIHRMVTEHLIKSDITTQKTISSYIFDAYETGKYNYTNKTKFMFIKLLKENQKLPPIKEIKNKKFYKQLLESRYYRLKLWMLNNGCDGLFR